jgi:lambda repressor-like predicted transcriptional regulator
MTPLEIKVALLKRGVSMRAIARRLGVSANSVSLVANKRMVSRRIMDAIANAVGTDRASVFPEYFNQVHGSHLQ